MMQKNRSFKIDASRTANFVVFGIKNTTDRVQNFSLGHHHYQVKPRQVKIFRVDTVYANLVRKMCRGTFAVKEFVDEKTIEIKNITNARVTCFLEDSRPVMLLPGDVIEVECVKFAEFYKEQPGLSMKVTSPKKSEPVVEPKVEAKVEAKLEVQAEEPEEELSGEDDEVAEASKPKKKSGKSKKKKA